MLFLCRIDKAVEKIDLIRTIVPQAVIFPNDFELGNLNKALKERKIFNQFSTYNNSSFTEREVNNYWNFFWRYFS